MEPLTDRVFSVLTGIVPQRIDLSVADTERELRDLGFDSMALVSLFIDLEAEFDLSVQAMMGCLHRRCTVGSLLDLCAGVAH